MKRKNYYQYSISLFIIVQLSCFALLGFWIYWYVSNDAIYTNIANLISPELLLRNGGIDLFVSGIVLLGFISLGLILIFVRLLRQLAVTRIYDNFIANVTHELRSPLASIQLGLETMQKRDLAPGRRMEFLELMTEDTVRLNKLIGSILEISLLDARKDPFEPEVLDAGKAVSRSLAELSRQYRLPEESLKITGKPECLLYIDPGGLTTVLGNLIDNSIKYSAGAVEIRISMKRDRKKFILIYKDSGIGIPKGSRKEIFRKFTRLHNIQSPNVKGTGLGLYWSRVIVRAHGGRISLLGSAGEPGAGFRIELPLYNRRKKISVKGVSRNFE